MDAVDGVPGRVLEPIVDGLPTRNQVDIDRLHLLAGDQSQRRIARGGDEIEPALVHQRHHLVGGRRRLDVDLAARLLLEVGDPVVVLIGLTALDVTGPGNDIDFAFALADAVGISANAVPPRASKAMTATEIPLVGFILLLLGRDVSDDTVLEFGFAIEDATPR